MRGRPLRWALAPALALLLALTALASSGSTFATLPEVADPPFLFEGPLPASAPVETDWFRDAVFLGDSRTEGLAGAGELVPGLALAQAGLNIRTARTQDTFLVDGRRVSLRQALEGSDWEKVYILLGVNEASWMPQEEFYSQYAGLIDDLREWMPQAKIYLQTLIPVTVTRAAALPPDNAALAQRSQLLRQLAREKQVYLVDLAAQFTGSNGALARELSSDGLHLSAQGNQQWLVYLRTHTMEA